GIGFASGRNNRLYNNVIRDSREGIYTGYGETAAFIYNNTVSYNTMGITIGDAFAGSINVEVRNNIIFANTTSDLSDSGTGTLESNNLSSDPSFVSPENRDFHLRDDSAAIDRGAKLDLVKDDFDQVTRPQGRAYDIGAYEHHK